MKDSKEFTENADFSISKENISNLKEAESLSDEKLAGITGGYTRVRIIDYLKQMFGH